MSLWRKLWRGGRQDHMIGQVHESPLYDRLRYPPNAHSVPNALPVLFFGDIYSACVATIGLNPSAREFYDDIGRELDGATRRLETVGSLGGTNRAALTDEQCARAIERMRTYFRPEHPKYQWFVPLIRVISAMGYTYESGQVAHLDLVQEATTPPWSRLRREHRADFDGLRATDLPFLQWVIEAFPLQVLICNGSTPLGVVCGLLDVQQVTTGNLKGVKWSVGEGAVGGRQVAVVGWNLPLAQPTGLGTQGELELGRILQAEIARLGIW